MIRERYIKDKKVTVNCYHGFTIDQSGLINLSAFSNEMSDSVNEGRLVDIVQLKLSRTLNTVSHKLLVTKPGKCRLDGWTTMCMESKLDCCAQKMEVNDSKSNEPALRERYSSGVDSGAQCQLSWVRLWITWCHFAINPAFSKTLDSSSPEGLPNLIENSQAVVG